jgi:hypothetical protein
MVKKVPPPYANLGMDLIVNYTPPQDKICAWHTVSRRRESFLAIATQYRVPVARLIEFNFPGSVRNDCINPDIVNWYLFSHRHFRCRDATPDGANYIFRGGEKVAIPFRGSMELGTPIIKKAPVSLDGPPGEPLYAGQKFEHEWRIPAEAPADLGYFAAQARISVEGEISQSGLIKTSVKIGAIREVKVALEKELEKDVKATFAAKAKVESKAVEAVANAIKNGSKEGFARAIATPFEATLKQSHRFGKFTIDPEVGGEISVPPVVIMRVSGGYNDILHIDNSRLEGKFTVKIAFYIGLSKKGWAWVVQRIGGEAVKRFASSAGRALAGLWEYLVAEGIVAAAGVAVVTIAATYLTAWVIADAERKGKLQGKANWYVTVYLAKAFGTPLPSLPPPQAVGDRTLLDKCIELGERDAVADARATLRKAGRPEANGTDAQVLEAFGRILIANDGGNYDWARERLQKSLAQKVEHLFRT